MVDQDGSYQVSAVEGHVSSFGMCGATQDNGSVKPIC